jgi:hypothetical protein
MLPLFKLGYTMYSVDVPTPSLHMLTLDFCVRFLPVVGHGGKQVKVVLLCFAPALIQPI